MNWYAATLARRADAGEELSHLVVDVPRAAADTFVKPGQWTQLKVPHAGQGTYALASAPGEPRFEFLVKHGGKFAEALLAPGASLEVCDVAGPGFPLEAARGRPLLLVASGTGIAPMRSVIEVLRQDRAAFGPVTLLWGGRSVNHTAFANEFAQWEADGVQVLTALSQPHEGWAGRRGYVQHHLPDGRLDDAVAFIVGQKAMTAAVRGELLARGLSADRVFLNL